MDGANVFYAETVGDTLTVPLSKTNAASFPAGGFAPVVDLSVVRGIAWRCEATGEAPAAWAGTAGTVVLAFTGCCGTPGVPQTALANHMRAWTPVATYLVGDFAYTYGGSGNTAHLVSDTAAWAAEKTAQTVMFIGGNHEWDISGFAGHLYAMAAWMTSYNSPGADHGPCFEKLHKVDAGDADAMVQVLALDPQLNSAGAYQGAGPDGLREYGTWHAWVAGKIAQAPRARYRIAAVHFPAASTVGGNDTVPWLAWLARSGWFDMIFCAHTHTNEIYTHHGTLICNVSSGTEEIRASGGAWQGAAAGAALIWANSTMRCALKVEADANELRWKVEQVGGGVVQQGRVLPRLTPVGEFEIAITGLSRATDSSAPEAGSLRLIARAGESGLLQWSNAMPVRADASSGIVVRRRDLGATGADNARGLKFTLSVAGA